MSLDLLQAVDMTQYNFTDRYQHARETCLFHLRHNNDDKSSRFPYSGSTYPTSYKASYPSRL